MEHPHDDGEPTDADVLLRLRGEILSGRGILVLDHSGAHGRSCLTAHVREAAYVAGRMGDFAIIDCEPHSSPRRHEPHAVTLSRSQVESHYRLVLSGKRGRLGKPHGGPWDRGAHDARPTNPYPTVQADAVVTRNLILVLRGMSGILLEPGSLVVERAVAACRGLREPPLVFAVDMIAAGPARLLKWEVLQAGIGRWGAPMCAMGSPGAMERCRSSAPDPETWRSLVAAAAVPPAAISGDGLVVIAEGGRSVLACAVPCDGGTAAFCADVGTDGWCHSFHTAPGPGTPDEDALDLARAVWRCGTVAIGPRRGQRLTRHAEHPSEMAFAGEGRNGGPVFPAAPSWFLDAVLERTQSRLQAACLLAPEPGKLQARLSSRVPGAPWRRQFALAFLGLSFLLLDPGVARAVDAGEEAIPHVADNLGVSHALARRLAGRGPLPYPGRTMDQAQDLRHLGRMLNHLGPDRVPRDADGFAGMADCVARGSGVLSWSNAFEGPALGYMLDLLVRMPGDWRARAAALVGVEDRDVADTTDFAASYQALLHAIDPRIPRDSADHVGLALMSRHAGLARYVEASLAWHADPILGATDGTTAKDAAWPVPFGRIEIADGWSATCLDSCLALVDEGAAGRDSDGMEGLAHCVATYGATCQAGNSLVVSLRHGSDAGERRIATLEFVPDRAGRRSPGRPFPFGRRTLALRQFRGRGNAAPSEGARSALEGLHAALSEGAVTIDDEALRPRSVAPGRGIAFARERLALWSPYLPRALSRLDADGQVAEALAVCRDDVRPARTNLARPR